MFRSHKLLHVLLPLHDMFRSHKLLHVLLPLHDMFRSHKDHRRVCMLLHCWHADHNLRIKFLLYHLQKTNYFYCAQNLKIKKLRINRLRDIK
jgi:hypothetical protein